MFMRKENWSYSYTVGCSDRAEKRIREGGTKLSFYQSPKKTMSAIQGSLLANIVRSVPLIRSSPVDSSPTNLLYQSPSKRSEDPPYIFTNNEYGFPTYIHT